MGTDITPKFYEILQKHLEVGTAIRHLAMSPVQKRRAEVCLDAYRALQEDPFMDPVKYLRRKYGRTDTELRQDKKVIAYLMGELNQETKELSQYRIRRAAEKVLSIGNTTGDWKALEAGAKLLHKAEGLDKPESAIDIEQTINPLPYVLVSAPKGKQEYDERMLDKLRKKYHAEKDKTQEMVEAKLGMFVPAGSLVVDNDFADMEPVGEDEEENMFDEFDVDDDGN